MTFIRSFIFNVCFFLWAMISAILFAPFFIISPAASRRAGRPWARGSLWLARVICGITYEIRGQQYIANHPVIYASKHQSAWDTIIFLAILDNPAYILKRSLLRIPLWGWYLWRMEMIAIDRSAGASTLKQMVKDSRKALDGRRSVVIFPEGTRKRPGAEPDYQPGVQAMYGQLKTAVVPIALNSGYYWGRDAFLKKPGTIVMEFLPPIPPGENKKAFSEQLRQAIEMKSDQLLNEAQQQTQKA